MTRTFIGLLMLGLLALSASAEDAITFKTAIPKKGDKVKTTIEEKTNSTTSFTVMGTEQKKDEIKTKSLIYIEEVLENTGNSKTANKLKRTYEKAVLGKDGKPTTLSVEGKTVLIEKKGDKYIFTQDGEAVQGEALKLLEDQFNKKDRIDDAAFIFPKKPVKPGESWDVDSSDLVKALGETGMVMDKEKTTGKATLTKAYKKDGSQFGVIDFVFAGSITSLGPTVPIEVKEAKFSGKIMGEGCIDGSVPTGSHTANFKFNIVGSVMGTNLKLDVTGVEKKTVELIK
jgi:hypothetical protein